MLTVRFGEIFQTSSTKKPTPAGGGTGFGNRDRGFRAPGIAQQEVRKCDCRPISPVLHNRGRVRLEDERSTSELIPDLVVTSRRISPPKRIECFP